MTQPTAQQIVDRLLEPCSCPRDTFLCLHEKAIEALTQERDYDNKVLFDLQLVTRTHRVNRRGESKFCGRRTALGIQVGSLLRARRRTECQVERRCLLSHRTLDLKAGKMGPVHRTEWVTRLCGAPLFAIRDVYRGVCRSCQDGFTHESNYPTEAGLATLASFRRAG